MKIYESTERNQFVPQKPYRAPWAAICALVASISFLGGYMVSKAVAVANDNLDGMRHTTQVQTHAAVLPNAGPRAFLAGSENPIADIVASASPSVVSIETTIHKKQSSDVALPDLLFSTPGGHPNLREPESLEAHGSGSGVIIRPDGYIMTNAHVVKDADEIKITLSNKREYRGRVVGRDGYSDVALVKIDANNLPIARMADAHKTRPGDWAIAIGSPLGLNQTVTMGIVSAVGRSLADLNNNVELIQTDAAINPGNSGGPLLNINGEVVGINMAIRTDAQNIGFSIPIDIAREAANAIIGHRQLQRPFLGISMIDFDEELARSLGVPKNVSGVLISKVVPKSPAERSGLREGDVIQRVNDQPVKTGKDVQSIVRGTKIGQRLDLKVFQAGKNRNLSVEVRSYPSDMEVG